MMNDRKTQNAMCSAANSTTYQKTGQANVLLVLTDIWPVLGAEGLRSFGVSAQGL